MILLTKEEKLVVCGLIFVLLIGTSLQYCLKKFPRSILEKSFLETVTVQRLNINTATKEELVTLPYIGEVTAKRILEYRRVRGSFKQADDLRNIPGIGPRLYERLTPYIRIEQK